MRRAGSRGMAPLGLLLLAALAPSAALAQAGARAVAESVYVRDAGPGDAGRILRGTLLRPHIIVRADTPRVRLGRGEVVDSSLVVLGGDLVVAGHVRGDVVVVGGDLWVSPGGRIEGRAVAIGGGVYPSTLAEVRGDTYAFRDITFDVIETEAGLALDYRPLVVEYEEGVVRFPFFGFRLPTYDRSDGVALPWGPVISLDSGDLEFEPTVTYRSDIGDVDPAVAAAWRPSRRTLVEAWAGRATFSNDEWIWPDIVNSLATLALGLDTRNHYRADRAEAVVWRRWEGATWEIAPGLGGRYEHASSIGPDSILPNRSPWSLFGRREVDDGMWRPNPPVLRGEIISALGALRAEWEQSEVVTEAELVVEHAFATPADEAFTQGRVSAAVTFPTFGEQFFAFELRATTTAGGIAPPQRWGWVGGSGTLPTFDTLLVFGGDELFFAESRYTVPIRGVRLPLVGEPAVALRYMVGGAGIGDFPTLHQNVGLRLVLGVVRADVVVNPETGDVSFSVFPSLGR